MQLVSKKERIMRKYLIAVSILFVGAIAFAQGSFDPHSSAPLTPHISLVEIKLMRTIDPDVPIPESVEFVVLVRDQFNNLLDTREGNLAPFLTPGQITQLQNFMDIMWDKAENEILP